MTIKDVEHFWVLAVNNIERGVFIQLKITLHYIVSKIIYTELFS